MIKKFSDSHAGTISRFEGINGLKLSSGLPTAWGQNVKLATMQARRERLAMQMKDASVEFERRINSAPCDAPACEIDISSPISPQEVLAMINAMTSVKAC
ncbi:hypothetical protein [Janthinobacterium sp. MDT1-19]|uniref:hypothetical protein n=1 Tax=Janthinobacterium sp. MDT1-19 TaxID=1259339 RepID=UPI003F2051E6